LDFNTLNAFVAVANAASFSQAAEQLHLTQPAVSKRVATLEHELGTRLFDRIGRSTRLTEAGHQLLPRARQMLQEVADIRRSISNLSGEVGGLLCMGTSHHIGLRRLPPMLQEYSQRFPQVKLDIRFMDSESACSAVEQGDLELAVVTLPPNPSGHLALQEIWRDPLCFVVGRGHPLVKVVSPSLEQIAEYPAVLAARGTYTREILEQAVQPMNLAIQISMATNYLETLKMLASIGLGWSLLPETMTKDGDLVVLDIRRIRLNRSLGIVTHRRRTLSNAAQEMIEICGR